jgi:hypothetical protein
MKKNFTIFLLLTFILAGCGQKRSPVVQSNNNQANQEKSAGIKGDIDSDMCKAITADFVYSATAKLVIKVEPDMMAPKLACRYYFTFSKDFYKGVDNAKLSAGGLHIFMMIENYNIAKQKEANEFLGLTVKTDPLIKMENQVNYRKDGSLYDIRLIINPNRYIRMDTNKGITDEELIQFAAKVAEKIQGNLSFEIKKNPIALEEEKTEVIAESQQVVVSNFLNNLTNLKIQDALVMMDANEQTKEMWQTNFNTVESLKINKTEEAFKEEWTATRQSFKVELDVKVKPEGEQLGWQNGTNFRWITLEKNANGVWMVHEIANNP